ncbi:winged helix-turn-helix domain-containing protein [Bradyrhizobium japonicum]|uniref:winged helix-turn-helix domain-containing protein n=1 Tax=Bradyrhizobium japonicum TaxID=375 RepID=UPI000576E069|nr:winged helix-turn-helix domain-containing protein [Bradyrhizobium japonicum]MBR0731921.1 winged helix-turn-helix domain-containing protein [Bradyrhizobium japonicum]MBR0804690.1 winged helix-turn-helix domain-containing protein [Bradyrhizobium japonicum]MCP1760446.1 TolB-like protein/Tfp pilus assembly protein PilF [Bradyrhizobium japonicum]MCP1792037.1 TolB-like protein/Tfp pilus assembly protein PilF [Bradyrhizobium japonicum]MCP1804459.1 TolB-like protein/Tfp pilus assembly protein PilF 
MRYLFEDFVLDTDQRELRCGAELIATAPQTFDLLLYLIRNRERVVSKDDLLSAVWNGRIVSDAALTTRMNTARSAIGDTGERQRLIKTMPRKGFRFVGAVQEARGPTTAPLGYVAQNDDAVQRTPSPPRLSIVVLPFANLSSAPEQDYFVDGVTGSLTTDLSRISGSFVIGQHTAFTYKGKSVDVRRIGRELNVRYALEGSVQRCDNRLRVNVQLIDATTGNHLWADRFDEPFADLLDMQDEIVARIARTLDSQLIVAEARRAARTLNPDAMDLYFQGRHSCNKGVTFEYLTEARGSFERALAIDPQNVDAMSWSALVETALVAAFLTDNGPSYLAAAEAMVLRALRLAPDHAWAHFTLAMVLIYTNRAAQGVAECERALALDRNLADAHEMMGQAKFYMGCGADTEPHVNKALRLSPRDISAFRWMNTAGFAKLQIAADAEAAAWCARGIEANRNYPLLHFGHAAALALLGRLDEAQVAAKTGLALDPTFTIRRFRNVPVRGAGANFVAGAKRMVKGLYIAGVPQE